MPLLTKAESNSKTAKNGDSVLSYILHLAPANLSGFEVCPARSEGCTAACLNTAGRGRFDSIQQARIWKTVFKYTNPTVFYSMLYAELNAAVKLGRKRNLPVVVRLNGTSDLDWFDVIGDFPTIQFYDYTKRLSLISKLDRLKLSNYDLTFSRSEVNERVCERVLSMGYRVAVVFDLSPPPGSKYLGVPTIDGDGTDLRYREPAGVVVALRAKGKARKDESGFVVGSTSSCPLLTYRGSAA